MNTPQTNEEAYQAGYDYGYNDGGTDKANPYSWPSTLHLQWETGRIDGMNDNAPEVEDEESRFIHAD